MHLRAARMVALAGTTTAALTLGFPGSPAHANTELLPMPGALSCASATNAGRLAWALRPITVNSSATVTSGQALVTENPATKPTAIDIRSNSGVGTSSWTLVGTLTQSTSSASGSQFLVSYSGSVSLTLGTYWITVRETGPTGNPPQRVCNSMSPGPQSPWSFASGVSPNYYYTSDDGTSYGTVATISDVPFLSLSASSTSGSAADHLPRPLLQQFGRPLTGTCNAAASATLNWAGVSGSGWGESWSEWINDGRGGEVCTRTLVYSNSLRRWTVD